MLTHGRSEMVFEMTKKILFRKNRAAEQNGALFSRDR
jgi:hypothetical protein